MVGMSLENKEHLYFGQGVFPKRCLDDIGKGKHIMYLFKKMFSRNVWGERDNAPRQN